MHKNVFLVGFNEGICEAFEVSLPEVNFARLGWKDFSKEMSEKLRPGASIFSLTPNSVAGIKIDSFVRRINDANKQWPMGSPKQWPAILVQIFVVNDGLPGFDARFMLNIPPKVTGIFIAPGVDMVSEISDYLKDLMNLQKEG